MSQTKKVIPFGEILLVREPAERMREEVYSSIPALAALSTAALTVSNMLSEDARNALFYDRALDAELRTLTVAVSAERRHAMEGAAPDLEWLQGVKPKRRADFETPESDEWLSPGP